jgi:hypothetical protein
LSLADFGSVARDFGTRRSASQIAPEFRSIPLKLAVTLA